MDQMVFVDDASSLKKQLEDAANTDDIARLMEAAEREESATAETYWGCVERSLATALEGRWEGDTSTLDGSERLHVELELEAGGKADFALTSRRNSAGNSARVLPGAEFVSAFAGLVDTWASDLHDVIDKRAVPVGVTPRFSSNGATCQVHFNITFTAASGSSTRNAWLWARADGVALVLDDLEFRRA